MRLGTIFSPPPSLSVLLFFATWATTTFTVKGISLQNGKINISQTSVQEWGCGSGCLPSQYCHLPLCTNIAFPNRFSKSGKVQVYVSLSHGEEFSRIHSPSALWVQSVTTRGFEVCARETGIITNETGIINWLAFQNHPQMTYGSVSINGIWTTQTKCDKVTFSQSFDGKPSAFVSAKYVRGTKPDDAMYVWLENVNSGGFEVCIREFLPFEGKHQDTIVDWFAFLGNGSAGFNFSLVGEAAFPNNGTPAIEDNYGFCQQVQFNTTFYSSPVVLVSVHHYYQRQVKNLTPPENNIITAWVEEVGLTSMRICVKDLSGTESRHDPLFVGYVVIGDLNPCLDVHCQSFGVCKTYSAHEARCVCYEDCPSYEDPVCTANGTTYDNKCWHQLSYCRGMENNLVYHPGSCEGFPIVRDRTTLQVPKWSDSSCKTVVFPPYRFYPDKKVHMQITVNHMYLNDSETVHDAVTSWTENINTANFTVCAMQSGRNTKNFNPYASVDWMAYQGSPPEAMTGVVEIQKWWSGTNCADVTFPKGKFYEAPVVLVTAEHLRTGKEYDAALIWTEDVTNDSFKVCLREMQNFDGKHEDINVNWIAFSKLHKPLFTDHGFVKFPNTNPPKDDDNNAYCKYVHLTRSYNSTPSVLISANHFTTEKGNSAPIHNGITTWIENMNTSGFRVCLKELYETRYDPVTVSYAVLTDICDPGWTYFNGYCYFTSETCTNWTTALSKCRQENSVLVDVDNNEENVFIQHQHNGEKSWLGFNDRTKEGDFVWEDRVHGNFTVWAKNQPNNFRGEDCVHALGVEYSYEWNDVQCSDCHQYTCKKDFEECQSYQNKCDQNADCINTEGSYECHCKPWYQGDGFNCSRITVLGLNANNPAHSCKEIRDQGILKKDGKYWIDPEKNGKPLQVYCDMTTDGGGWLLVSDVVIDNSSPPRLSVATSYRGISGTQMVLQKSAMNQLRTHLAFSQIRFHCKKKRTFHVTTTTNSAGESVVQYFSGQTDVMPTACGSYVIMNDDNSFLARACSRWGWDGAYYVDKWGHRRDQSRLYDHPAFIKSAYHFLISPGGSRWECDDYGVGVSPGYFWKVFVR